MENSFRTADTQLHSQRETQSSNSRSTFPSSTDGRIVQMMNLQKTIGNKAVLQLLKSQRSIPAGEPIQRKKTSKPADSELTGLIGTVAANDVIAGKTTESEKGDAIWAHVQSTYNSCLTDGGGYLTTLNEYIAKYKGVLTKPTLISEKSDKRLINDAKFRDNYSHTPEALGGTAYRINSKGFDPARTAKPVVDQGLYEGDYSNEFDISSGKIKAAWNFAEDDEARKAGKGINNSEILWDQHKLAAEEHYKNDADKATKVKQAQKNISRIVRDTIINDTTRAVMYMTYDNGQDWKGEDKTLSPGDEEFSAILGTPNCKSSAFMLRDHLDELEKTFDKIEIKRGSDIEIKFKEIT